MARRENTYEITFSEFTRIDGVIKMHRQFCGTQEAKNGIAAIKTLLAARLHDEPELLAELESAWTGGSNKRLVLAGTTFEARKLS